MDGRDGNGTAVRFDGYDVTDTGNGISAITVPKEPEPEPRREPSGFFARLFRLFRESPVAPYAKIRDLGDPTGDRSRDPWDADAGSDGKLAGEVGIRVRF